VQLEDEINRLKMRKQFPPSMKKGEKFDVPDGIIVHLTRDCGGNMHGHNVVEVTCGSFEKETYGVNPHSGAYDNLPNYTVRNAADLGAGCIFASTNRHDEEDIPHRRNNWVCYDFKERAIVPRHCTIRTNGDRSGYPHLKSWLVETSADGQIWREVAREEDNQQLNGSWFAATFPVALGGECRFIRLVNVGRNQGGYDSLAISAWRSLEASSAKQ
jgi:hypothetical protein